LILFRRSIIEGKIAAKVLLSLTAAVVLLIAAPRLWAVPELAGRARILAGTVAVDRGGEQEILKADDPLFVKDRIITGPQSSAEIVFVDESRMKLAADTYLEITDYLYKPAEKTRQGLISLTYGRVRFAMRDFQEFRDRRFRVLTRTAVVGSSDTDFIVAYDRERPRDEVCRDGLMTALCLEDSVVVISLEFPEKPAVLTSNMISRVCGPNIPAPPRFATPAELAGIRAGLDLAGETRITPPGDHCITDKRTPRIESAAPQSSM
jgi:hypothetical protein